MLCFVLIMPAILYSFRRCPYAMRGRMALHVSGVQYEHREIILRDKPAAMLNASPKGTVPVFITEQEQIIDESLDLMLWALKKHDPLGWLKTDMDEALSVIRTNDGPFKHHLDRYKYASRYKSDAKRGDVDTDHRIEAEVHIQSLENRLVSRPHLMGETQTLADVAIFPFIRQFANTDSNWWETNPYPRTRDWLLRHVESDLFKSIMTKHKLWQPS